MTRRTEAMYVSLLNKLVATAAEKYQIDLEATNVSTDFEKASINAFRQVFPNVVVSGCHFHLGQSVLRKVNELGLKKTYCSDQEFALHCRMLYSMAYLPVDKVPEGLEIIRTSMPAVGKPLVEYFDKCYVRGAVLRTTTDNVVKHRPPMFPAQTWNIAERFEQGMPTTSNHVEAWHHRVQTLIVTDHPSFYGCLRKLREEQRHTEVAIMRAENGFRSTNRRRSVTEHHQRLSALMADLKCSKKDLKSFLRGVAHSFGRYGLNDEHNDDDLEMGDDVLEVERRDDGGGEEREEEGGEGGVEEGRVDIVVNTQARVHDQV